MLKYIIILLFILFFITSLTAMANDYHITAAAPPNDTDEANTANTYYISAGIIPTDIVSAPSGIVPFRRRIEGD